MAVQYNYSSTAGEYVLQMALTPTATVVQLDTVTGLPGAPFKIVVEPGQPTEEIVKVTTVAGTSLTVERGWDGTSAVSHGAPCKVRHMMTAEDLRLSRQHEDSTAAHGTTGDVVGTTDTQVLTNKNLTSASNSFPATLATLSGPQKLTGKDLSTGNTFPANFVTTTAAQSLTNKTLNSPTLTGPYVLGVMTAGSDTSSTQAFYYLLKKSITTTDTGACSIYLRDNDAGKPNPVIVGQVNGVETNRITLNTDGSLSYGPLGSSVTLSDTGIKSTGFGSKAGWSIETAQYRIKHGVCQVYVRVQRTGVAVTPPADTNIANVPVLSVPSVAYPSMPASGSGVADGPVISASIWTDGVASLTATAGTIATSDYISMSFTYLV